ncbi:hypothetical protein OHA10_16180 [Kribbella sp. NBC_00662]|uniref:hypothetical protein n=1 Tax=Kribbella sp. NBC_00662 TaxID=2975969 RepID=UPI0032473865
MLLIVALVAFVAAGGVFLFVKLTQSGGEKPTVAAPPVTTSVAPTKAAPTKAAPTRPVPTRKTTTTAPPKPVGGSGRPAWSYGAAQ